LFSFKYAFVLKLRTFLSFKPRCGPKEFSHFAVFLLFLVASKCGNAASKKKKLCNQIPPKTFKCVT